MTAMATMYRKILVGYDDSEQSKDAVALGRQLADATGGDLVVAGVFEFDPSYFPYVEVEFTRKVEAAAEQADAEAVTVRSHSAARGIHELAEEIDADLVVVGSAHQGRLGQILAGSVGIALLHGSPCAMAIAPSGYRTQAEHDISEVVVGVDGSPESGLARQAACALAQKLGARLKLVTAAEPPVIGVGKGGNVGYRELYAEIKKLSQAHLAAAVDAIPDGMDAEAIFVSGEAAEALIDSASVPGSLIVVGSRGYGPLRRVLMGSLSTALVRAAPCPLIVIPRGMHDTSGQARERDAEVAG
jgi:nucleotide-binding universal stress UspA family protein